MLKKTGKIEHFEKQFGIIAIEKGYITAENLIEALKTQIEEDLTLNDHRLIGEILMDMGCLSAEQIQEVLKSVYVR